MKPRRKRKSHAANVALSKFLLRSSATTEVNGNATTTCSICSEDVNCKLHDYIPNELNRVLGHGTTPYLSLFVPTILRGYKNVPGKNRYKNVPVTCCTGTGCAIATVLVPPYMYSTYALRDQSLALVLLRLEKLRVTTALAPGRRSASRLFSKLAFSKEQTRSRSLVMNILTHTFSLDTLVSNRDSHSHSRGN